MTDRPTDTGGLPTALVCTGCGERLPDNAPLALTCPRRRDGDDTDHLLAVVTAGPPGATDPGSDNPFVRWRRRFHSYHRARAAGWSDDAYVDLVTGLDLAVAAVDGTGFRITPFARAAALSDALGFSDAGGLWVKDETGGVSGSHKARHLFGTMLALHVEEARLLALGRPPQGRRLAIASCGNAALAAAVVATATGRQLEVFIPTDAEPEIVRRLRRLGATCTVCGREPGVQGDPTYHALRRAVDDGAVAFTCQGDLNGLAVEGGRTLGWELAAGVGSPEGPPRLDRIVVQVGGGALLSSVVSGLAADLPRLPRVHAVQPAAVHPLARAFERVRARTVAGESPDDVLADAARHRSRFMWAWEQQPHSVAHGILDDETYDWRACVSAMLDSGGGPLVVAEGTFHEANQLARATTGIDVDPTGTAGLAGVLDLVRTGAIRPDENVAVIFTGAVRRPDASTATSGGM